MSYLNLDLGLIVFEDQSTTNPKIRTLDHNWSIQGCTVTSERSDRIEALQPGDLRTIIVTTRPILQDSTTEYRFWQPNLDESIFRLEWTGNGTAPNFRVNRAIGVDATTQISITRINAATVRIASAGGGTPLVTTAVQVGDFVKFEKTNREFTSVFSPTNQGMMFRVVAKGGNWLDVLDNGAAALDTVILGGDFASQMAVLSSGPVIVGDTLELADVNINNIGKYPVVGVSGKYIDVTAPLGVEETFVGSPRVKIYERLIGFLYIRANGGLSLRINDQAQLIKLSPLSPYETIFLGSVQAYKIDVVNESTSPVSATVFHASVC